ncbi:hypothetical protein SRHO_G00022320 [Serrasalmus rhombeus]
MEGIQVNRFQVLHSNFREDFECFENVESVRRHQFLHHPGFENVSDTSSRNSEFRGNQLQTVAQGSTLPVTIMVTCLYISCILMVPQMYCQ